MSTFTAWQVDLFLLEHWQEDSPLSVDAQREEIFAKYVALGVCGREPYRNQQRRLEKRSVRGLPVPSQELLDRIRLPAERDLNEDPCWLRTCYDPSTEGSWARIQDYIDTKVVGSATVFNDSSLYNFGSNWEKIFLRAPQLLDNTCLFEEYEENVQEAREEGIESDETDPQRAEESGYDPEEDGNPWICFYSEYLFRLAAGHIYIVDGKTLASEGPDAGTVLIVWYDECGRAIRYYREKAMHAAEIANLDPCYLKEPWTKTASDEEVDDPYGFVMLDGPAGSIDSPFASTYEFARRSEEIPNVKRSLFTTNRTRLDTNFDHVEETHYVFCKLPTGSTKYQNVFFDGAEDTIIRLPEHIGVKAPLLTLSRLS